MPTLVYFNLQGRAQPIRYALAAANVDYEDKRLTNEEWSAAKTEGTYGEGNQLPVLVADDGQIMNQGGAILKMICAENGFAPADAKATYEMEWFFDTNEDDMKSAGSVFAEVMFAPNASAESVDKLATTFAAMFKKLDARYGDDRAFIGGASACAADFRVLTTYTAFVANPHQKNPSLGTAL